ncbi:DmsC/YnfH family molybdoenzyme membrane anchor subunit [Motiliproteus sp. MSK22-1]|uniref:dimethyl sulfoxide reductase anchor subunit family protein n=1 Tax=Motiliproteus sp. MSK22-1 TaxID=1897630 RepID=UPI000976C9A8|nr:DmsC/YnfH family molybdoenzyme membrane anchor subunit [Motiliproteus sp. MSK22-1]OMH31748.1 DMSO reductase [Motiliproteus sp. MSK22-1]
MHPAFSVLIFTVASGAGYGLLALLIMGHLMGMTQLQDNTVVLTAGSLSLALITGGLLTSTLHLANPKNAWRAFSRFKTSWLSREAVFAILVYPFALTYLLSSWASEELNLLTQLAGILTLILSMMTLFCTSMIYASLKTIRQWNTSLTPLNYLVLGLMSGSLLLVTVQGLVQGSAAQSLQSLALLLVVLGASVKLIYLFWIGKPAGSTINTATGFTQAKVRLLDAGHTADTFLTNEFGYEAGADKLLRLRAAMLVLAFVVPFILMTLTSTVMMLIAALLALAGLLVERWLFFAEARHVVRLFHGDQAT